MENSKTMTGMKYRVRLSSFFLRPRLLRKSSDVSRGLDVPHTSTPNGRNPVRVGSRIEQKK